MITTDTIINYLNYYNYHDTSFNEELGNINIYAHRVIICIRKYLNLLEKHPTLDINMEDPDVQKVELYYTGFQRYEPPTQDPTKPRL